MAIPVIPGTATLRDELLTLDEDHFIDLKSVAIAPAKLQTHFVAFANADGGELYVGIEDKKTIGERIKGFPAQEKANDMIHTLLSETRPSIEGVEVEFIDFATNGLVLHISVPKSQHVHYTSSNECYIRVNASSRRITGEQISRLGYAKGSYSYERVPVMDVKAQAIADSPHLKSYLLAVQSGQESLAFLKKQHLLIEIKAKWHPTVACVLLFDEEPQATLKTRCAIKVYRLRTTEKEYKREHLAEMPATIEGPLEEQISRVIEKVDALLEDVSVNVGGKLAKLEYPAEALKEILVNAVIHRDYSMNDDIHVKICDNRVEIQSPGKLPGYVTIDNILEERYSRNPSIVRLLHKLPDPPNHDIGEGLNTAYNAMRNAGLIEPVIQELENAVLVTIEHKRLASLEEAILDYLKTHAEITNKIVRQLTGEGSENKVKKALQNLREQGKIEPVDQKANAFRFRYRLCQRGGDSP